MSQVLVGVKLSIHHLLLRLFLISQFQHYIAILRALLILSYTADYPDPLMPRQPVPKQAGFTPEVEKSLKELISKIKSGNA